MRLLLILGILLLTVTGIGMVAFRLVGHDAARWHLDPDTADSTGRPNSKRIRSGEVVFDVPPEQAMDTVDRVIRAQPRVSHLAGEGLMRSYVQRSRIMGYPDYISVKVSSTDSGSTLAIFSRSRFGRSDFGVNRARVKAWVAAIGQDIGA